MQCTLLAPLAAMQHCGTHNMLQSYAVRHQCGVSGGGTRGLGTIEALRAIEASCGGRPIHQLFDVLCGTSTGGILAVALGVLKRPLDEVSSACHTLSRHFLFGCAKPKCSLIVCFTASHLLFVLLQINS